MTELTRHSAPENTTRLIVAWLAVAIPLAWGIATTVEAASALRLSAKLGLTLLPLVLGAGVCIGFYHLDKSRFTVRGVVGPYFAAVALLFSLFASLLATEVWGKVSKQDLAVKSELNELKSILRLTDNNSTQSSDVRDSVRSYLEQMRQNVRAKARLARPERESGEPLQRLYQLAGSPEIFKGNIAANTAFFQALQALQLARDERLRLSSSRLESDKFFSLLLFGFLTQVAIAFCHAGNPRAIGASVILFSIAFSASIGILALLGDPDDSLISASILEIF